MTTLSTKKDIQIIHIVSKSVTDNTNIATARTQLNYLIGHKVVLRDATILKRITRHEYLKLYVQPLDSRLTVFAEFTEAKDALKIVERKIRKASSISLTGEFVSFGNLSLCLKNCRLIENN